MRRLLCIATMVLLGCGSKPKSKTADDEKSSGDGSPGTQCIDDAKTRLTPPTDAPDRMDIAQILVRHAGVRDAGDVSRTREEACLRAGEARQALLSGSDWAVVYKEYSDSQGATEGVLYDVTQGSLDPAFGGAAFSLKVDELSYPVETKRGFHIIWRKK